AGSRMRSDPPRPADSVDRPALVPRRRILTAGGSGREPAHHGTAHVSGDSRTVRAPDRSGHQRLLFVSLRGGGGEADMIDDDVKLGANVRIFSRDLVNLFGCEIGDGTFIVPFVEVQVGTVVGPHYTVEI